VTTGLKFPKPPKREAKPRRPMKRSWIKRKRPRRLSRNLGDPAYMAFVRTLPCAVKAGCSADCEGPIHAHHAVTRARGGKDDTCIPLCNRHHMQWHDANGVFAGMTRFERFAWSVAAIEATQRTYRESK